ncbi:MAG: AmmeMemoRadiSam system protein B [Phycisphaeraceae bacterium]|nr:AmmeMemoRadiSam system protein B [Phycisphaeraceae bacterium]
MNQPPQQPTPPKFNPAALHHQHPRLRPVRGFAAQIANQTALGLADARQISDKAVFTSPAFQNVLPLLDGQKSVDDIVKAVGRGLTREPLEQLVAQLDDAGLLYGPTFDAMLAKMRADFDSSPVLPPASTAAFADALAEHTVRSQRPPEQQNDPVEMSDEEKATLGAKRLQEVFDEWIAAALKDAPNPSMDTLPRGIVVPHIDYQRGWLNYASVWGRLRVVDRPDRVVILGTNHFGECTGVCGCDKGYQSPFGVCNADENLISALKSKLGSLGETLFAHRFDHEREHSIELQIPWVQHCFGKDEAGNYPKVFAALIHDPSVNNGESYDGNGIGFDVFVAAMREALAELPGKTLVVSSADLSHVGPAFGDPTPLAGEEPEAVEARNKTFGHDRELIQMYAEGKVDEMISSMAWQQNPTRWCSLGNMAAAFKIAQPSRVHIFNYAAAMDEKGGSLVSNVGMALE